MADVESEGDGRILNKTPRILTQEEFTEHLQSIKERLDKCGYQDQQTRLCYLIGVVSAIEEMAYTGEQLEQIFDLGFMKGDDRNDTKEMGNTVSR